MDIDLIRLGVDPSGGGRHSHPTADGTIKEKEA